MTDYANIGSVMGAARPVPTTTEMQTSAAQAQYYGAEAQRAQTENQQLQFTNQVARYNQARTMQYINDAHTMSHQQLAAKYPDKIEEIKKNFDSMHDINQTQTRTMLGSAVSLAQGGHYTDAADYIDQQHALAQQAGQEDEFSPYVTSLLRSSNPADQAAGKRMLAHTLLSTYDPKEAPANAKALGIDETPLVLKEGDTAVDPLTNARIVVPHELKTNVTTNSDGSSQVATTDTNPQGYGSTPGGLSGMPGAPILGATAAPGAVDASGSAPDGSGSAPDGSGNTPPAGQPAVGAGPPAIPAGASPKMAAVAHTLNGYLPDPVVAGFMGNFHIEGGYGGAKGDGGSASGIAQLRGARVDNFRRVMGKDPTQATPQEQAQFVLHEMQNPQEAGMTVAQRDAILAAKTPAQAAALIDQYYERSDGTARNGRMSAATAWARGAAASRGGAASGGAGQTQMAVAAPQASVSPTGDYMGPAPGSNPTQNGGQGSSMIPNTKGADKGMHFGDPNKVPGEVAGTEYPNKGGPADWQSIPATARQRMTQDYIFKGVLPQVNGPDAIDYKNNIIADSAPEMDRLGITADKLPAIQQAYQRTQKIADKAADTLAVLRPSEDTLRANVARLSTAAQRLQKLGVTGNSPFINEHALEYYAQAGTQDQKNAIQQYHVAASGVTGEYAKFMSAANGAGGSGAPPVALQGKAEDIVNKEASRGTLNAGLDFLLQETNAKRTSWENQASTADRELSSYARPRPGAKRYTPAEAAALPSRTLFTATDGQIKRRL